MSEEEMVTFQVPRDWLERVNQPDHPSAVEFYQARVDFEQECGNYWLMVTAELARQAAMWVEKDRPQHPDKNTPWGTLCTHTPDGFEVVLIGPDPQVPERGGVVFSLEDCAPYTVQYRLLTINKEQPSEPYHRL